MSEWVSGVDYPEFYTSESLSTIRGGYLLENETPRQAYERVARAAAKTLKKPELEKRFFDLIWSNKLCLASPIVSNLGSARGLPISCNSVHVGDNLHSIFNKNLELAVLTKHGAGVGIYMGDVRGRGAKINNNGTSNGILGWLKVFDSSIAATSQGNVRRGAAAVYLPTTHPDFKDFLRIRRPTQEDNMRCMNLHHAACISDEFMHKVKGGDLEARELWKDILLERFETGEPYMFFSDNVNRQAPECYKKHNLKITTSNICVAAETQILTDKGHVIISDFINKKVNIWDGEQFSPTVVRETGVAELYNVVLSDGTLLTVTAGHKFPIKNNYHKAYTMLPLSDLKVGDKLAKFEMPIVESGIEMEIDAYSQGFYAAEGNTNYKWSWVYTPKAECMSRLIGKFKDSLTYNRYKWEHGQMLNKTYVPFNNTIKNRLDWLAGLLDGDGVVTFNKTQGIGNTLQLASTDKKFLMDVKLLLTTLGVNSKVTTMHRNKEQKLLPDGKGGLKLYTCQSAYRLLINGYEILTLKKLGIRFNRLKLNGIPNRSSSHLVKIVSIEKANRTEMTYCFTNKNNNLGTFNGVVTGNCNEIYQYTDEHTTFVCCLSSLNLVKWDTITDQDIQDSIWFLDAVMSEYIEKASTIPGFEAALNSAIKGRALGLGVLGWHTYLQKNMIPFESFKAMQVNNEIFKRMREQSDIATAQLAQEYGEPEWCVGFNRRNTLTMAVAPTVSNSILSGSVSQGIEPIIANAFAKKSAKGTFISQNAQLREVLAAKGKDTPEVWSDIATNNGSVQHFSFLTEEEKLVFKTAYELDQKVLVQQAAQRQRWIDQGQSLNLFFTADMNPKQFNEVHLLAWELGLKGLYYLRASTVIKGDVASRGSDCLSCHG